MSATVIIIRIIFYATDSFDIVGGGDHRSMKGFPHCLNNCVPRVAMGRFHGSAFEMVSLCIRPTLDIDRFVGVEVYHVLTLCMEIAEE